MIIGKDLLVCLEPLLRGLGHADPGSLVQALQVLLVKMKIIKNEIHADENNNEDNDDQELEGGYQGDQRLINCIGSRLRSALASQV